MTARFPDWLIAPFAKPLKLETLRIYGIDESLLEMYEGLKDEPMPEFGRLQTFRGALIEHGQSMKQLHGDDYWASRWVADITPLFDLGLHPVAVVPDCRFMIEYDTVGLIADVELVHVSRLLPNNTWAGWSGDIGSYLRPAGVKYKSLMNTADLASWQYEALMLGYHTYRRINGVAPAL